MALDTAGAPDCGRGARLDCTKLRGRELETIKQTGHGDGACLASRVLSRRCGAGVVDSCVYCDAAMREDRGRAVVATSLGRFVVEATTAGVARVRLPNGHIETAEAPTGDGPAAEVADAAAVQIAEYARGERESFDVMLDWSGIGDEHRRVLDTLVAIAPFGQTVTYGALGARAGIDDPREIGVHMNRNPFPILVPCHRVVAADGLGGYGGGIGLKRRLLELEGALPLSLDLGDLLRQERPGGSGASGQMGARSLDPRPPTSPIAPLPEVREDA